MSEEDTNKAREYARDKYKNLSEEDKIKKREYARNRYHNMSEEDKYKNLFEEEKNKKQSIEKIGIIICLKKKSKNIKSIKKYREANKCKHNE